jgi:alpha-ribazole phosphatase
MRLFLIRHCKPLVAPGVCYGGGSDPPVVPEAQARLASQLAKKLPKGTPIFSSPLQRCAGLAYSLASLLRSGPVVFDSRLAEMHFGTWEMQSWDAIPLVNVDAWANDLVSYRPGGGESVMQVAERVHAFYESMRRRRDDNTIVVCHAGTIRLLLQCQRKLAIAAIAQLAAQTPHEIGYGEFIVLDC